MRCIDIDLPTSPRGSVTEPNTQRQNLLESVAKTYRADSKQDDWMRTLCVQSILPWLREGDIGLEIGCSNGLMTEMLAGRLRRLTVVEAASEFAQAARNRQLVNVKVCHQMVEAFEPVEQFDCIFLTWVLTHIEDVQGLMRRLQAWLRPAGRVFVVTPNARVLSRQLALHMDLIQDLYALTENDRNHGHVRAYDRVRLVAEAQRAGFQVVHQSGLMLKPLADFQMDELFESNLLTADHVQGLYRMGLEYPDLSSAILLVCSLRDHG